jgi:hypothetical protein
VTKMALGQDFIRVLRFYLVSILPPMSHTHLSLNNAVVRRTRGQILVTFTQSIAHADIVFVIVCVVYYFECVYVLFCVFCVF